MNLPFFSNISIPINCMCPLVEIDFIRDFALHHVLGVINLVTISKVGIIQLLTIFQFSNLNFKNLLI
jgi:hypothetical protein